MQKENMQKVYILLTRTNTIMARFLRQMTGDEFTHASLALDAKLDRMYSFARRNFYFPLIGGFIAENIHTGVFGHQPDTTCALYELEVSAESYQRICAIIQSFFDEYALYRYSFLGLALIKLGIAHQRPYRFFCSQFVAYVLSQSGALELPKDCSLITPNFFAQLPQLKLVYKGPLHSPVFSSNAFGPTMLPTALR